MSPETAVEGPRQLIEGLSYAVRVHGETESGAESMLVRNRVFDPDFPPLGDLGDTARFDSVHEALNFIVRDFTMDWVYHQNGRVPVDQLEMLATIGTPFGPTYDLVIIDADENVLEVL